MAGSSSKQLRSAFVPETVPGTIDATPAFRMMHTPALFDGTSVRYHQLSLVSGGRPIGDTLLDNKVVGSIAKTPLTYGHYDVWFESMFQSSFVSNVLSDDFQRKTLSIENSIPAGIGGTNTMMRWRGVEATDGTLEVDANGVVYTTFSLRGMANQDTVTTAIAGATYAAPANNDPFSSQGDFPSFTIAGYTLDAVAHIKVDFAYDGREDQPQVGTSTLAGITRGGFIPKITVKLYTDTNFAALRDIARQQSQSTVKVTINLGSVTGKKYKMEFWTCYIDMSALDFSNPTTFLNVVLSPAFSTSNGCIMTMTRALV